MLAFVDMMRTESSYLRQDSILASSSIDFSSHCVKVRVEIEG